MEEEEESEADASSVGDSGGVGGGVVNNLGDIERRNGLAGGGG